MDILHPLPAACSSEPEGSPVQRPAGSELGFRVPEQRHKAGGLPGKRDRRHPHCQEPGLLAGTSKTMLNKSGESGPPCLVPDLRGNAFSFSPLSLMLVVGLSYMAFIMLSSTSSTWYDVNTKDSRVDCTNLTRTECNFTANSLSEGFPRHFNISLRLRAKLGDLVSAWVKAPWFEHYRNATIGPPEDIWVTPEEGSLIISFSSPFDVPASVAFFSYYVYYWEKAGIKQVTRPFRSNFITLNDLKPLRVYCFQVKAELFLAKENISRPGHLSNISCSETTVDASTKLQQVILISMGTFLLLSVVVGACLILVLKYRGLVKYWFHSPPSIPSQIEEYLKDPAQSILDALDKDSSSKDDDWDSVSIVSFPENEQDILQSTLNQGTDPSHQPVEGGP
ncbi:interferon gamma receptor 2 isoform X1 [Physeter macrocephalus]|uniref:Interferon gamma receptor 2 isoform X1 n=1 Tax=Physeter macrocephalus TaxID=9755 RepID=A0A455BHY7_PHYMC|nr:interferon gamma receptor 2 isoform X1 [Physeter catodon]